MYGPLYGGGSQDWRAQPALAPSTPKEEFNKKYNRAYQNLEDKGTVNSILMNDVRQSAMKGNKEAIGALDELANRVDGRTGETRLVSQELGSLTLTPPKQDEETPAAPVPDAAQDPGGFIAATVGNRAMGRGNQFGMPEMPKLPTPQETERKAMGEQAKQVMFDQNKIPKWNESRAFSAGLLSFGLNLLSGNDLATSFAAAGQHFDDSFSKEKRELWANDLVEQGYDAQDIQRWIQTGDNKDLTDPMEKKMKMMQYETAAQQLDNLQYANSPEMRQFELEDKMYGRQLQQYQLRQAQANSDRNAERADMKAMGYLYDPINKKYVKASDISMSGSGKVAPRDELLGAVMASTDLDLANRRIPTLGRGMAAASQRLLGDSMGAQVARDWLPDSAGDASRIIGAQKQFVQGPLRLATGASAKDMEEFNFQEFLFPQGSDFDDPQIVARKQAAQAAVLRISNNIATGRSKEISPGALFTVVQGISTGKYQPLVQDGMLMGVQLPDGRVMKL